MDGHIVLVHIQIPHLVQRQTDHLAGTFEVQAALVPAVFLPRAVEHGTELFGADRLHQVMECGHVVALGDVIRVAGDEDDLHGFVLLPDHFGQRDTICAGHFYIKQ